VHLNDYFTIIAFNCPKRLHKNKDFFKNFTITAEFTDSLGMQRCGGFRKKLAIRISWFIRFHETSY